MSDYIDCTDFLKDLAKKNGIDLIGVANKQKIASFTPFFECMENGSIAFYKHPYSEKTDYLKVWDKTKSVISFAVSYNTKKPTEYPDMSARGKISRAAYGTDYHILLKQRAENMMEELAGRYSCEYEVFVDTGRLSDRVIAFSAGLGFYGKNNFIINETYGSFLFLGHILTDINLKENDKFINNLCGECNLCLTACPNKANGQKNIQYEKCISYITQSTLKSATKGYIYGCDICQEVCSFNHNALSTPTSEFTFSKQQAYPEYKNILNMGKDAFEKMYSNSAMLWVGYNKICKNCMQNFNLSDNDGIVE